MRAEQWLHVLPLRLRALFRRRLMETELDEELQFHLAQEERENGGSGNVDSLPEHGWQIRCKEDCRDTRGVRWLDETWQDFRANTRSLWRSPGFTTLAVLMLALALG